MKTKAWSWWNHLVSRKEGVCDTVGLPFTLKISSGKRIIIETETFHDAKK
jgi:hypothetical protein